MSNPFIGGQSAMTPFTPPEQRDLERRQRIAEMLRMQAARPVDTGTQMAGGWAVPNSPVAPFERLGQALIASRSQSRVDADEDKYMRERRQQIVDALKGFSKDGNAEALLNNPDTAAFGLEAMMGDRKLSAEADQAAMDRRAEENAAMQDRMAEFERAKMAAAAQVEAARLRAANGPGASPYYQFLPGQDGYLVGNSRTGEVEPAMVNGRPAVPGALSPPLQAELSAAREGGKVGGRETAEAAIALPGASSKAQQVDELASELLAHPGLSDAVGVKGAPYMFGAKDAPIGGTDAAGFEARLKQLQGGAFLEAFQMLKGGGAVTEIEGIKAEQSYARISTAQTEEEFRSAVKDFVESVKSGVKKLEARRDAAASVANPVSATGAIMPTEKPDDLVNMYRSK
jgi:hypothetical protein